MDDSGGYPLGLEDEGFRYGDPEEESRASDSPIPSGIEDCCCRSLEPDMQRLKILTQVPWTPQSAPKVQAYPRHPTKEQRT